MCYIISNHYYSKKKNAAIIYGYNFLYTKQSLLHVTDSPLAPQYHTTANDTTGSKMSSKDNVSVELDEIDLWRKFHVLGTEMIVTRSGR